MLTRSLRRLAIVAPLLAGLGCGSEVLAPEDFARMSALIDGAGWTAAFAADDAVGTLRDRGAVVDLIGQGHGADGNAVRIRIILTGFRGLGLYALALTTSGFTYGEILTAQNATGGPFASYQTGLGLSGTVRVTSWDPERRRIGGFFEFRARQTTSTRTIDLTQGVFNGLLAPE